MSEPRKLSNLEDLDSLWGSGDPVLFFKHSNRCGCSHGVIEEYRSFLEARRGTNGFQPALVVVQDARDVAKELEARTGVRHHTPQAILVKDGRVLWHASHWGITLKSLEAAVEKS